MDILAWIVVGIIAGFLAKAVVPGEGPGGVLGDLVVGVIGAILGGWLFNFFGHVGATGLNVWTSSSRSSAVWSYYHRQALTGRRVMTWSSASARDGHSRARVWRNRCSGTASSRTAGRGRP